MASRRTNAARIAKSPSPRNSSASRGDSATRPPATAARARSATAAARPKEKTSQPLPPPGLSQLESLFHDYLNLKKLRRTGWQLRGIRDGESLADHCFGTALLTLLLAPFADGLDRDRAVRLSLVHELGECRVGDIPFPALAYLKGKSEAELAAVADLVAPLGAAGEEYRDLFVEFERQTSAEARFVKGVDKLEMLVTALEYQKTGFAALGDFWENESTFAALAEFPVLENLGNSLRQRHRSMASGRTTGIT